MFAPLVALRIPPMVVDESEKRPVEVAPPMMVRPLVKVDEAVA